MNIADRIQHLRKIKGISQEELAEKVGVSRQAVSKWEGEQSIPDIDKIMIMSEFFDATTDYILKGIEPPPKSNDTRADANIFVIVATVLNLIGLAVASAVWYEKQVPMALVIGLVFMAMGCLVYGVGLHTSVIPASKAKAKQNFWMINIWLLSFIPLSFAYNVLFTHTSAPYPLLGNPWIALPVFWLVYIGICLSVVLIQVRKGKLT